MAQPSINPVAKTLYLCDGHIGFPGGKTDLVGLFSWIRPPQYPHRQKYFVIFAQLIGGLGQVPFYIDIRYTGDGSLVHSTMPKVLHFPHRDKLVQLACTIQGCLFPQPGRYLVELFCNGQWVADTTNE
jgi:hypothetical protein